MILNNKYIEIVKTCHNSKLQSMADYPDNEAQAVKPYEAGQTMADPASPAIASLAFLIWRKATIYYPAIVRLLCPADPYLSAWHGAGQRIISCGLFTDDLEAQGLLYIVNCYINI